MAVASSASILLLPQSTQRVIYTPLLEEFHRDTVSRVYFNSGTPFASDWCVRHTRDCGYFHSYRSSSTPHGLVGPRWSRTTR
jgi:hypothetical protein